MTLTECAVREKLSPTDRKFMAIQAMARTESITALAARHGVSRPLVYRQRDKASATLDELFSRAPTDDEDKDKVLYSLPVTRRWLRQVTLGLTLIAGASRRGVVEFMRDLLGVGISEGTVHNIHQQAAQQARSISAGMDLSAIRVGLHDEIFQGSQPVLAGIDAASTYCYLLAAEAQRDGDTWAIHLLDLKAQGLNPDYVIADAGTGLRAGQKIAWPDTPCHGDVFHIQQQFETVVNIWTRIAGGATSKCEQLEARLANPRRRCNDRLLLAELARLRQLEAQVHQRATDLQTLADWLARDILSLAGPELANRQGLFDFIVDELRQREHADAPHIGTLRRALHNQRDDLLAFAAVLDVKLATIARDAALPEHLVRATCVLHRKPTTSSAFWRARNQLYQAIGRPFYDMCNAVERAMRSTPRSSSLVENFNSRLRTRLTLRRHLNGGNAWLDLQRFSFNHRCFARSRRPQRVGKTPREVMTGHAHPHWLTLLGLGELQPHRG
jgi:hypothetical protein